MTASLHNKGSWRNKQRKKDDKCWVFRVERFQALAILLEVLTISEQLTTLFEGVIHV